MYRTTGSSTEILKLSDALQSVGEAFLKCILTYLYCIKYNEINICNSDAQKYISYTGSHKRFLIHNELCLKMAGNVF